MNKTKFIILFLFISQLSFSQKNYYQLSIDVIDTLAIKLNKSTSSDMFFCVLGQTKENYYLTLNKYDSTYHQDVLNVIESSDRYIKISDKEIPIIFSFDLSFSKFFFHEVENPQIKKSIFYKRYYSIGGYTVIFSNTGEVIDVGTFQ